MYSMYFSESIHKSRGFKLNNIYLVSSMWITYILVRISFADWAHILEKYLHIYMKYQRPLRLLNNLQTFDPKKSFQLISRKGRLVLKYVLLEFKISLASFCSHRNGYWCDAECGGHSWICRNLWVILKNIQNKCRVEQDL